MKILELKSENVKRISAVHIEPDGTLVVVGGKNGAGKSSVLDSIMYALAGKKAIPRTPLRNGESEGSVTLSLDADPTRMLPAMKVVRTFSEGGKTQLEITSDDGYKAPSPQTILDDICGRIAFDPLEFTRMKPADQAETLRGVVGLDFTEQDAKRKELYDKRTVVNRDGKQLKARCDAIEVPGGLPDEPIDVAALIAKIGEARTHNNKVAELARDAEHQAELLVAAEDEVKRLEQELKEAKVHAKEISKVAVAAAKTSNDATLLEVEELEAELAGASEINDGVKAAHEKAELESELEAERERSKKLGKQIDGIDAAKTKAMAEAEWPVEGLGFDDQGVTLNGLPFEQASSAEQLRVSVAMGIAMNPALRVLLIRDGSLLDDESLAMVGKLAEDSDAQVWMERVGSDEHCSVVIEDGHIAGVVPEEEPEAVTA